MSYAQIKHIPVPRIDPAFFILDTPKAQGHLQAFYSGCHISFSPSHSRRARPISARSGLGEAPSATLLQCSLARACTMVFSKTKRISSTLRFLSTRSRKSRKRSWSKWSNSGRKGQFSSPPKWTRCWQPSRKESRTANKSPTRPRRHTLDQKSLLRRTPGRMHPRQRTRDLSDLLDIPQVEFVCVKKETEKD